MTISSLFTRRTGMPDPADWTPDGTVVVQRYRALGGGTVLVYTADVGRGTAKYAVACLGCAHRAVKNAANNPMSETDAAKAANAHAAVCRAMPRGVPVRPDDIEAADMIRTRLWGHRYGTVPHPVRLSQFDAIRVDLHAPHRLDQGAAGRYRAGRPRLPHRDARQPRSGHPFHRPALRPVLTRCVPEPSCCSRPPYRSPSRRPSSLSRPAPGS